eukprot:7821309-Karenia_brevis.AAC.1
MSHWIKVAMMTLNLMTALVVIACGLWMIGLEVVAAVEFAVDCLHVMNVAQEYGQRQLLHLWIAILGHQVPMRQNVLGV